MVCSSRATKWPRTITTHSSGPEILERDLRSRRLGFWLVGAPDDCDKTRLLGPPLPFFLDDETVSH